MHEGWLLRGVLAAGLGLGTMGQWSRADDAQPPHRPESPVPAVPEQAAPFEQPVLSGDVVLPPGPPEGAAPRRSLRACIRDYLTTNVPILCWSHHNSLGCGNFVSEFNFLFGSCRSFYGEPCLRRPPPPVPPGYWPGYGYGPAGPGDCRCPQ